MYTSFELHAVYIIYCTEFVIVPTEQTVAQGQEVVFHCQHSTAHVVSWRLNERFIDSSFLGVATYTTSLPDGITSALTMEALSQYNTTRVECLTFFESSLSVATDVVTLIIQGSLL